MRRFFSILMIMALLFCAAVTASAHEVPDLTKNGTITLTMNWMGEPLDGGSLSMYRVGQIAEDDGNYSFVPVDELGDPGISLENPGDEQLAATLAEQAEKKNLPKLTAEIKNGQAVFTDVAPGLYVVVQDVADVTNGFAAINPFLISMPQNENGHYNTDVAAVPKVPIETEPPLPTEPEPSAPTEPSGGKLPQTGQLRWPVSVLTMAGLMLVAIGWRLRFGQKKET